MEEGSGVTVKGRLNNGLKGGWGEVEEGGEEEEKRIYTCYNRKLEEDKEVRVRHACGANRRRGEQGR